MSLRELYKGASAMMMRACKVVEAEPPDRETEVRPFDEQSNKLSAVQE